MDRKRLAELTERGWRLTRDGSTASALRVWEDEDDADAGWELLVLKSSGHAARFTLEILGSGTTERGLPDALGLTEALAEATELMRSWQGELLED